MIERRKKSSVLLFSLQNMSISVSVLTLMAISIERYQAIVHPLKFSGTKQRARILILSVWILSLLLVLPGHCIALSHPIRERQATGRSSRFIWWRGSEENFEMSFLFRCHYDDVESTIWRSHFQHLSDLVMSDDVFLFCAFDPRDVRSCQWDSHPLFDLLYQLHISLCLFVIPLCLMVFTYSGITRVLWGSLPTERMFSHERRTIICNPPSYSGWASATTRE